MSELSKRAWSIAFLLALEEVIREDVPVEKMAQEMDLRRPNFQSLLETEPYVVLGEWRDKVIAASYSGQGETIIPGHPGYFHRRDVASWLHYALSQKTAKPFYRLISLDGFSGTSTQSLRSGVSMPALHAAAYENSLIGFNILFLNELALHGEERSFWNWLDNATDDTGTTILCRAGLSNSAIFRQLLSLGVEPTVESKIHKVSGLPIHATLIGDQQDSFGLLLPTLSHESIAHRYGELDVIGLATALGRSWALQATIDAINRTSAFRATKRYGGGNTVMHLASVSNDIDTVRFWIEKAPELLNERNVFGDTPLVGALSIPNPTQTIVMALAKAGSLLDTEHIELAESLSGGDLKEFLLSEIKRRDNIARVKTLEHRDFMDHEIHEFAPALLGEERTFE